MKLHLRLSDIRPRSGEAKERIEKGRAKGVFPCEILAGHFL